MNEDDLALWREYCADPTNHVDAPPGRDFYKAPDATWRSLPPTENQLAAIRKSNTFATRRGTPTTPMPKTRGEASDIISASMRANGRSTHAYADDHDDLEYQPRDYGDL